MKLGNLNKIVVLINTDFLNEQIRNSLIFYKGLYPNKNFEKINIADLLYKLVPNAIIEEGDKIDILFSYTLSNSKLEHCTPNALTFDISSDGVKMETDKGTFFIRAFFGDENETCSEHFVNMLQLINGSPKVSRIIMVADTDNSELTFELERMSIENEIMNVQGKKWHYTETTSHIAYALGLNGNEIYRSNS